VGPKKLNSYQDFFIHVQTSQSESPYVEFRLPAVGGIFAAEKKNFGMNRGQFNFFDGAVRLNRYWRSIYSQSRWQGNVEAGESLFPPIPLAICTVPRLLHSAAIQLGRRKVGLSSEAFSVA
jgi:hypothetical protein